MTDKTITFEFENIVAQSSEGNITICGKTKTIEEWQERYRKVFAWMEGEQDDSLRAVASWVLWFVAEQTPDTRKECLDEVKKDWKLLRFIDNQTEEMCLAAVRRDGYALEHAREQTEAICLVAVNRNGLALQYVEEPTEEMCLAAAQEDGNALEYVLVQTEAICLAAVNRNGCALKYIRDEELRAKIKGLIDD